MINHIIHIFVSNNTIEYGNKTNKFTRLKGIKSHLTLILILYNVKEN